eukprot:7389638-Prymnesium_polylepis.1
MGSAAPAVSKTHVEGARAGPRTHLLEASGGLATTCTAVARLRKRCSACAPCMHARAQINERGVKSVPQLAARLR